MVEKIAHREGFGDLLAEGSKRAAKKIGGDAMRFSIQAKGQEFAMHEPRGKYNVGIGYAISEIGADHLVVAHDPAFVNPESNQFKSAAPLGITVPQPARVLNPEKMNHFYALERWNSLEKVIGYCFFGPAPRSFIHPHDVLASVNAATGWNMTMEDILLIGERATNMARVFNAREGFTRKDDTLPERIFTGLENGPLQGNALPREDFEQALTTLYELKGWNPETGTPTRERLESLSLDWAVEMLPD
jgi:aldehyde:ferredoxin oxidoreductase